MSAAPETPLTAAEQRVAGSQVTTMWSSCAPAVGMILGDAGTSLGRVAGRARLLDLACCLAYLTRPDCRLTVAAWRRDLASGS